MASAANEGYGNPAWGSAPQGASPWGNTGWQGPGWQGQGPGGRGPGGQGPGGQGSGSQGPGWQGPGWAGSSFWYPMGISRPLAIALMILGFIFFWPVGLAILIGMVWSGRMGCWGRRRWAAYQSGDGRGTSAPWNAWKNWCSTERPAPSSGNRAFDEYRTETLRRLEEEQKEFGAFLERLRFAKDKAEFDEFMAQRRTRPTPPPASPDEQPTA